MKKLNAEQGLVIGDGVLTRSAAECPEGAAETCFSPSARTLSP